MTNQEYDQLKVGQVIKNGDGAEFMVTHVTRDAKGAAQNAAITPNLSRDRATIDFSGVHWQVVSKTHSEMFIGSKSVQG